MKSPRFDKRHRNRYAANPRPHSGWRPRPNKEQRIDFAALAQKVREHRQRCTAIFAEITNDDQQGGE